MLLLDLNTCSSRRGFSGHFCLMQVFCSKNSPNLVVPRRFPLHPPARGDFRQRSTRTQASAPRVSYTNRTRENLPPHSAGELFATAMGVMPTQSGRDPDLTCSGQRHSHVSHTSHLPQLVTLHRRRHDFLHVLPEMDRASTPTVSCL